MSWCSHCNGSGFVVATHKVSRALTSFACDLCDGRPGKKLSTAIHKWSPDKAHHYEVDFIVHRKLDHKEIAAGEKPEIDEDDLSEIL